MERLHQFKMSDDVELFIWYSFVYHDSVNELTEDTVRLPTMLTTLVSSRVYVFKSLSLRKSVTSPVYGTVKLL